MNLTSLWRCVICYSDAVFVWIRIKLLACFGAAYLLSVYGFQTTPALAVKVSQFDSGLPLSAATVSVWSRGKLAAETETADDGVARFSGVRPSDYLVSVHVQGYRDPFDASGRGEWCSFRMPDKLECTLSLVKTAAVSGTVLNSDGQPATDVMIMPLMRRLRHGSMQLVKDPAVPPTRTDEQGRYRVYNLMPGRYALAVFRSADSIAEEIQGPTYYPGTPVASSAEIIEVNGGEERTLSSMMMGEIARPHELSGTVAGIPSAWQRTQVLVTLFAKGAFGTPVASTQTDAAGHFSFPAVQPGHYQISAFGPLLAVDNDSFSALNQRSALMPVSVGDADVQVDLALSELPHLGGEINYKDGADPTVCGPIDRIQLLPEDGWLELLSPGRFSPAIQISNSRFQVSGVPEGLYGVGLPQLLGACHLDRVMVGERGSWSEVDSVSLKAVVSLRLEVSAASGSLSGTVTRRDTQAVHGMVALVRRDTGRLVQCVPIDASGRYRFDNVPPGLYWAFARQAVTAAGDLDPSAMAGFRATPCAIEAGRKTMVDLQMEL